MDLLALALAFACTAPKVDALALADAANAVAEARSLGSTHALLASEPHVAGTPGDAREIERLRRAFAEMGLEVEVHRFRPYLCKPIEARLEIVGEPAPPASDGPVQRRGVLSLDLREKNLLEDPATAHADLTYGWNAYSGSGEVTAGVVYANYGTRADFAKLKEWGVDVRGKIVLARYGGNFRGYKAKFAEEAGAAGLLIYTDPADTGFVKGPVWPEGGWANDTCIQRGSLVTLDWPGDPLTPGVEATADAKRLDPAWIDLPHIPVQPIGYAAAERIMARMSGREVTEPAWRGGVRQTYRLEGGNELQVHLLVRQERFVGDTANVVATLRGATHPEEYVVVGCHHDAWCFGAADPLAGTMVLLESARSFAEATRNGVRPDRSIVFAAWGAEEFGIIGSTEWVEGRRADLERHAVAYINLDMASMGSHFGSGSSPAIKTAIAAATRRATDPFTGGSIYEAWTAGRAPAQPGTAQPAPTQPEPSFGDLGGGSDHVGFWCHALVPSCSLGAGGSAGNSYHSNYDTVAWYRATVGDDYRSALLVTRATNAVVAELATGELWPDDPLPVVADSLRLLRAAKRSAPEAIRPAAEAALDRAIDRFERLMPQAERVSKALADARQSPSGAGQEVNKLLLALREAWLAPQGLPGRPWFRNLYAATDRYSGYAPAMLPLVAEAIEDGDLAALDRAIAAYEAVAVSMGGTLDGLGVELAKR